MAKESTKAVAVSNSGLPAGLDELGDILFEDGAVDKGFDREDIAVPFLRVLQSLSPQLKKNKPEYIEGASEGDFLNTVTQQTFPGDPGIIIVPVIYSRSYTEWKPRGEGKGGLVKDHGKDGSVLETCHKGPKGQDVTPDGNEIVTAGQYFVYRVDPETGAFEQAVMALSGTQLKKSRKLNSLIASLMVKDPRDGQMKPVAPFYMSYRLTTVPESNDSGDWMGLKIEPYLPTVQLPNGVDIYKMARTWRDMIEAGSVKVQSAESSGLRQDTAAPKNEIDDTEIPF